ncbi:hypothetical protein Tco_0794016 [Tanacetum coccineum]
MSVRLVDRSFQYPVGIAENMFVEVGKFTFPADFVILQMEEDKEDFDALLDEGSKILHSIKGTLLEEEIFSEFDEFRAMAADENSESESDTKEPPFEQCLPECKFKGSKEGNRQEAGNGQNYKPVQIDKEALMTMIRGQEMSRGIFVLRETDEGYYDIPLYSRFKQVEYKGVPPPLSGDYTPRAQEDIDDSLYVYGKHGPSTTILQSLQMLIASSIVFSICPSNDSDGELGVVCDASSTHYSTCQSNDSDGELGTVTDHSVNDDSIPIPSSEQVSISTKNSSPRAYRSPQTELESKMENRIRNVLKFYGHKTCNEGPLEDVSRLYPKWDLFNSLEEVKEDADSNGGIPFNKSLSSEKIATKKTHFPEQPSSTPYPRQQESPQKALEYGSAGLKLCKIKNCCSSSFTTSMGFVDLTPMVLRSDSYLMKRSMSHNLLVFCLIRSPKGQHQCSSEETPKKDKGNRSYKKIASLAEAKTRLDPLQREAIAAKIWLRATTKTPKRLKEDKDDEAKDDEPTKKLTKRRKQIARKDSNTWSKIEQQKIKQYPLSAEVCKTMLKMKLLDGTDE